MREKIEPYIIIGWCIGLIPVHFLGARKIAVGTGLLGMAAAASFYEYKISSAKNEDG